ncbi:hypothetical protein LTR95_018715 [Oleoguttula sp. CCFEE 5521]
MPAIVPGADGTTTSTALVGRIALPSDQYTSPASGEHNSLRTLAIGRKEDPSASAGSDQEGHAREKSSSEAEVAGVKGKVAKYDASADILIQPYALADKLGDLTVANLAIGELLEGGSATSRNLSNRQTCPTCQSCATSSPLRRLAVDEAVYESLHEDELNLEGLPRQYLQDVFCEYLRLKSDDKKLGSQVSDLLRFPATDRDKCYFHQHNEDHPAGTRAAEARSSPTDGNGNEEED